MRIAIAISWIILLSNFCFGATINVPADQPTIQAGIDVAVDGDIVLVAPGTYTENIDFNGKNISVVSSDGAEVTALMPASVDYPIVKFVNGESNSAVLSGFKLSGAYIKSAIFISGSSPRIEHNFFTDNRGTYQDDSIIKTADGASPLIKFNLFYDNPLAHAAIHSVGNDSIDFINNTIHTVQRGMVICGNGSVIKNNIVTNCTSYGFLDCGNASVRDYNNIWNNADDYYSYMAPDPTDISEDPLFVDPQNYDLSLQNNSPCIDAGDPDPIYDDWYGTRNDIGALPLAADSISFPIVYRINLGAEDMTRVVENTPVIYWSFITFTENESQTDLELEVGTDDDWSVAEMWLTGQVNSPDTFVVYSGSPLVDDNTYYLRARGSNGEKWSEWAETSFRMKSRPQPPTPESPIDYESVGQMVRLTVTNSLYNDEYPLNYTFEIYSDPSFVALVASETLVAEQPESTSSNVFTPFEPDNVYYWRARSHDGLEYSDWSTTETFFVRLLDTILVPSEQPTIQAGIDAAYDGDIVLIASGTYNEQFGFNGKSIVVCSEEGPINTIILGSSINDPDYPTVLMDLEEGTFAALRGFTLEGGPIAIKASGDPTIENNILTDQTYASWAALVVEGPAKIINNTICHGANGGLASSNSEAIIKNNIIAYNSNYAVYAGPIAHVELSYNNTWGSCQNVTFGPGSIGTDPMFIDESVRNYILLPESPCVDAGDPDPRYLDIDGTRNDMGAISLAEGASVFPIIQDVNLGMEDMNYVVENSPTFYWSFVTLLDSESQTDYELEVGNDNDWSIAEMWAPGQVNSSDTFAVYSGNPLVDDNSYFIRVRGNNGVKWSEWGETSFRMKSRPGSPTPESPIGHDTIGIVVQLTVKNSSYNEEFPLTYDFELYTDEELTTLFAFETSVDEQIGSTSSMIFPDIDLDIGYWWRARSYDGFEYSEWSDIESFFVCAPQLIMVPSEQPTIQAGIDLALDGDTVLVSPGTYTENISFRGKRIVVISSNGSESTTIQASDISSPVVFFTSGEPKGSKLSGFTITGSSYTGIYCINSSPTIMDNIITGNSSNTENIGAGIHLDNVSNAIIRGNKIHGNTAHTYGCGIHFSGNSVNDTISYNILYGNIGYFDIRFLGDVTDCEISNNTLSVTTHHGIVHQASGYLNVRNNIVFFSPETAIWGNRIIAEYNCTFANFDDYSFSPGVGSIYTDAQFRDTVNRDYGLLENSPCIDAGDPDPTYNDWNGTRNDIGAVPFASDPSSYPYVDRINMGSEEMIRVVEHMPTIYWSFLTLTEDESQTDYELEVGTDDDWSDAEMWATGQINSSDTSVVYSGNLLVDDNTYYIRIRGHNGIEWSEWAEISFRMKSRPQPPTPESPISQEMVGQPLQLTVTNSSYNDAFALNYEFEIYTDSELVTLYESETAVAEQTESTSSGDFTGLETDTVYWWRARSYDDYESSDWSVTESFFARAPSSILVPSEQPTIQAGIDAAYDGDTVLVAPGVYDEQIHFHNKEIVVCSEEGPSRTIILGSSVNSSEHPTVRIHQAELPGTTLRGFTLRGGPIAISIDGGSPTIEDNILTDQTLGNLAALHIRGPARIINNTICNGAGAGINCYNNQAIIENNIIAYLSTYAIRCFNGSMEVTYNDILGNLIAVSLGPGSISTNPMFIDDALRDYNLLPGSPCIDAGDPNPIYNDGNGTRNDMGALSFASDPTSFPFVYSINMGPEDLESVAGNIPIIYWSFLAFSEAESQTGFELEVGADDDWSVAEMWSTGQIISADSFVVYSGLPLIDNNTYHLRIRGIGGAGWGDWSEISFRMKSRPQPPIPASPIAQEVIGQFARLMVSNSVYYDGYPLKYEFEIYFDPELATLFGSESEVVEQAGNTRSGKFPDLEPGTEYWWRARSYDIFEQSEWSVMASFVGGIADTIRVPSEQPTIQAGIDAAGDWDVVLVAPGVYDEQFNFNGKGIVVCSEQGPSQTKVLGSSIIDHDHPTVRIDQDEGPDAMLRGFTLEGGPIAIWTRGNPTIEYNILTDQTLAGGAALMMYGPARIINNTICHGRDGGILCGSLSGEAVLRNNIIRDNLIYAIEVSLDTYVQIPYNNISGWTFHVLVGPGTVHVDPLFVDDEARDYHLLPESPCINAGDPDPMYNDWNGTRNDMGALPAVYSYEQLVIVPDTLHALQQYAIVPETLTIVIGNLFDFNSNGLIDQSSILLNDSLVPLHTSSLSEYPGFLGEVVGCSFLIPEVLRNYGVLWDITEPPIVISGEFTDDIPFIIEGEFLAIGHLSGDANLDGVVNIADAIFAVNAIFKSGQQPRVPETADANCDGFVNIADIVRTISFIFRSGEAPCHVE